MLIILTQRLVDVGKARETPGVVRPEIELSLFTCLLMLFSQNSVFKPKFVFGGAQPVKVSSKAATNTS
jgi:hypothetical protein